MKECKISPPSTIRRKVLVSVKENTNQSIKQKPTVWFFRRYYTDVLQIMKSLWNTVMCALCV